MKHLKDSKGERQTPLFDSRRTASECDVATPQNEVGRKLSQRVSKAAKSLSLGSRSYGSVEEMLRQLAGV